ncbi:MAG: three-Cys-motif partner protein TcmP [Ignavibacteriae bacterium]|nr:three-Cys-motif partner protein TcmP [Ignavibacteriota bacterium]
MDNQNNRFGGFWTEEKIDIFIKYVKAYLKIMTKQNFKLIYFDGFAGSGEIESKNYNSLIEGVAIKVLNLESVKKFLVELNNSKLKKLEKKIKKCTKNDKNIVYVGDDCNKKIVDMSKYMRRNEFTRAVAFIDPYGLEVNWNSISVFKDLGVDMWILIPTGGVNRMLKNDGNIKESWMEKLSSFLGLTKEEIKEYFYKEEIHNTLFGDYTQTIKETKAVQKVLELYEEQLKTVFKYVSKGFPLKNSRGSIMFHFLLATNNASGLKIANDIIGKELTK